MRHIKNNNKQIKSYTSILIIKQTSTAFQQQDKLATSVLSAQCENAYFAKSGYQAATCYLFPQRRPMLKICSLCSSIYACTLCGFLCCRKLPLMKFLHNSAQAASSISANTHKLHPFKKMYLQLHTYMYIPRQQSAFAASYCSMRFATTCMYLIRHMYAPFRRPQLVCAVSCAPYPHTNFQCSPLFINIRPFKQPHLILFYTTHFAFFPFFTLFRRLVSVGRLATGFCPAV